ncbi:MAG: 50S ribosomal protein L15 [Anaerolineae bacterium]|jgi:large subunit ribosomal protein L15|nr:50S ribosomal protein L15 [Anaerolineae bacterium]
MKLHDLRPDEGAKKNRKRVGRGISAGQGKTAGRGTKGQLARSGGGKGAYFEGGQLPLVRRLPFKRGFTNIFRTEYQEVNVDDLARVFSAGDAVTPEALADRGLIRKADQPVVILGRGELAVALKVKAHRFSKSAQEKIEQAGGSVETLEIWLTGPFATVKKLRKDQLDKLLEQRAAE